MREKQLIKHILNKKQGEDIMGAARVNDFLEWVFIALALVLLPVGYYCLWLLVKEFYKPILVAVLIFTLIDLFILEPKRSQKVGP